MEASVTTEVPGDEDRRSKEERQERVEEVKARLQELDKEYAGREMTGADKQEFEDLENERLEEERIIAQLEDREAVIERAAKNPESRVAGADFQTRPTRIPQGDDIHDLSTIRGSENPVKELRDRAKTVVERMQFPQLGTWGGNDPRQRVSREDVQAHIERLIDKHETDDDGVLGIPGQLSRRLIATSSDLYRKAFWKQAAESGKANLTQDEQRALAIGSPPGAGSAVPVTLDPTVIPTSNSSVNPIRAISRVETITGNTWNGVSSGAITAGYVAEATAGSDNTPTIAAPSASVQKAHAFVPFSYEAGGDWGQLEAEMGRLFQDSKDDLEAVQFITGVGTTVFPQGVAVGTTNTSAAASGLTVTAANVYALENALPPRFRPRETFIANRGIYNVVRGIDTAGGAALWLYVSQGLNNQAPNPGNTGATLLGAPAYEATGMQATVVNATKIMIVGDFGYYLVLDRIGMNIEFIPNLFSGIQPTGQRGLYAWWRNTAKVLSANAFVAMTGTT